MFLWFLLKLWYIYIFFNDFKIWKNIDDKRKRATKDSEKEEKQNTLKWRNRRWKEVCQRNIQRKDKEIFRVWLFLFHMNIFITYVKHAFLIIYLCIQEAPVLLPSNSYVFWEINSLDKLQLKKKMLKTSSFFSLYSAIKEQRRHPVLFNEINFSSNFKLIPSWK